MDQTSERGASAVEFALVVPLLVALVFGIVELGRAYNTQITLTHAARESVRTMAITNNRTAAIDRAVSTATGTGVQSADVNLTISTGATGCTAGATTTVVVTKQLSTLTGIVAPIKLTGRGTMRCGG